jgi:membrane protein required for colicin V production
MMASMGVIDWTLLAILVLSVVVGLWRGLVFEVLSLLGWVVAYVAGQWLAPWVGQHLPVGTPGSAANHAAAFALAFIGVLIAWGLAARLVRLLISVTPLSLIDRLLGAVFGLLRGAVLLLAATTVVLMTPMARSPAWAQSHGGAWLTAALQDLRPVLPEAIAQHLPGEGQGGHEPAVPREIL